MKKNVKVGNIYIGGDHPITIQSMTNTLTYDIDATVGQILALEKAGCEIVRVSVPDIKSGEALKSIKSQINIPLVADIHFDYKLALLSADSGADKIRINPGNIDTNKVQYVADYLKERNIPIRIGINGGSLAKGYENMPLDDALVASAMDNVRMLEKYNYDQIILSVKASSVPIMVSAYRKLDKLCDYPLHIGVTEAGTYYTSLVKSSIGIGTLLLDGIGSTIRVSQSAEPIKEIYSAKKILNCAGIRKQGVEVISCPTCARTTIDVEKYATIIEDMTKDIDEHIKIAIMGCVVNGLGEGKEADFGVAGGKDKSIIFVDGKNIKTVDNENILNELISLVECRKK